MRAEEIAKRLNGQLEGNPDLELDAAAPIETAQPDQITFWTKRTPADTNAGCLLVRCDYNNSTPQALIRVPDPRSAFARVLTWLHPQPTPEPGIHSTAVVDPSARVGSGTYIGPHCHIGTGATIGSDCIIHSHVTLYPGVTLGDRVVVHAGAV
ncbi:MAG: hypothetical protein K2Q23_12430, partial [Bryobacteraceae bacterium]|nr:hypothetical protein [Bryobacteraceae bacterium]